MSFLSKIFSSESKTTVAHSLPITNAAPPAPVAEKQQSKLSNIAAFAKSKMKDFVDSRKSSKLIINPDQDNLKDQSSSLKEENANDLEPSVVHPQPNNTEPPVIPLDLKKTPTVITSTSEMGWFGKTAANLAKKIAVKDLTQPIHEYSEKLNGLTKSDHLSKFISALCPILTQKIQPKIKEGLSDPATKIPFRDSIQYLLEDQEFVRQMTHYLILKILTNFAERSAKNGNAVELEDILTLIVKDVGTTIAKIYQARQELEQLKEENKRADKRKEISQECKALLELLLPNKADDIPLVAPIKGYLYSYLEEKAIFDLVDKLFCQIMDPQKVSKTAKDQLEKLSGGSALLQFCQVSTKELAGKLPESCNEQAAFFVGQIKSSYPEFKETKNEWLKDCIQNFAGTQDVDVLQMWQFLGGYVENILVYLASQLAKSQKAEDSKTNALTLIAKKVLITGSSFFEANQEKIKARLIQIEHNNGDPADDEELLQIFKPLSLQLLKSAGLEKESQYPIPAFLQGLAAPFVEKEATKFFVKIYCNSMMFIILDEGLSDKCKPFFGLQEAKNTCHVLMEKLMPRLKTAIAEFSLTLADKSLNTINGSFSDQNQLPSYMKHSLSSLFRDLATSSDPQIQKIFETSQSYLETAVFKILVNLADANLPELVVRNGSDQKDLLANAALSFVSLLQDRLKHPKLLEDIEVWDKMPEDAPGQPKGIFGPKETKKIELKKRLQSLAKELLANSGVLIPEKVDYFSLNATLQETLVPDLLLSLYRDIMMIHPYTDQLKNDFAKDDQEKVEKIAHDFGEKLSPFIQKKLIDSAPDILDAVNKKVLSPKISTEDQGWLKGEFSTLINNNNLMNPIWKFAQNYTEKLIINILAKLASSYRQLHPETTENLLTCALLQLFSVAEGEFRPLDYDKFVEEIKKIDRTVDDNAVKSQKYKTLLESYNPQKPISLDQIKTILKNDDSRTREKEFKRLLKASQPQTIVDYNHLLAEAQLGKDVTKWFRPLVKSFLKAAGKESSKDLHLPDVMRQPIWKVLCQKVLPDLLAKMYFDSKAYAPTLESKKRTETLDGVTDLSKGVIVAIQNLSLSQLDHINELPEAKQLGSYVLNKWIAKDSKTLEFEKIWAFADRYIESLLRHMCSSLAISEMEVKHHKNALTLISTKILEESVSFFEKHPEIRKKILASPDSCTDPVLIKTMSEFTNQLLQRAGLDQENRNTPSFIKAHLVPLLKKEIPLVLLKLCSNAFTAMNMSAKLPENLDSSDVKNVESTLQRFMKDFMPTIKAGLADLSDDLAKLSLDQINDLLGTKKLDKELQPWLAEWYRSLAKSKSEALDKTVTFSQGPLNQVMIHFLANLAANNPLKATTEKHYIFSDAVVHLMLIVKKNLGGKTDKLVALIRDLDATPAETPAAISKKAEILKEFEGISRELIQIAGLDQEPKVDHYSVKKKLSSALQAAVIPNLVLYLYRDVMMIKSDAVRALDQLGSDSERAGIKAITHEIAEKIGGILQQTLKNSEAEILSQLAAFLKTDVPQQKWLKEGVAPLIQSEGALAKEALSFAKWYCESTLTQTLAILAYSYKQKHPKTHENPLTCALLQIIATAEEEFKMNSDQLISIAKANGDIKEFFRPWAKSLLKAAGKESSKDLHLPGFMQKTVWKTLSQKWIPDLLAKIYFDSKVAFASPDLKKETEFLEGANEVKDASIVIIQNVVQKQLQEMKDLPETKALALLMLDKWASEDKAEVGFEKIRAFVDSFVGSLMNHICRNLTLSQEEANNKKNILTFLSMKVLGEAIDFFGKHPEIKQHVLSSSDPLHDAALSKLMSDFTDQILKKSDFSLCLVWMLDLSKSE